MGGAFYRPLGEGRYRSTEHTAGPWSAHSQHLGPPSALLVRELLRCSPRPDTALARVSFDILGPVPVAEVEVRAWLERPGRSVELLCAELSAAGRVAVSARAWRMVGTDTTAVQGGQAPALPPVDTATAVPLPGAGWGSGYLQAVEWRGLSGQLLGGQAAVWGRPLVALVDGEQPSPLEALFSLADSASGVSSRLDIRRWLFINTELTVHLHRQPVGEWIGLDARTEIGPGGVGLASCVLHDSAGPVGRSHQALLVRPREQDRTSG